MQLRTFWFKKGTFLLVEVFKNISYGFVGFVDFLELNMSAQLVVHFLVIVKDMLGGGLAAYICCMVSTISFFNLFFTSKSAVIFSFLVFDL
jgi:hypothetical protein